MRTILMAILVASAPRALAGKHEGGEVAIQPAQLPAAVRFAVEHAYPQAKISDRPGHESVYEVLLRHDDERVEVALSKAGKVLDTERHQDEDEGQDRDED